MGVGEGEGRTQGIDKEKKASIQGTLCPQQLGEVFGAFQSYEKQGLEKPGAPGPLQVEKET